MWFFLGGVLVNKVFFQRLQSCKLLWDDLNDLESLMLV